MRQEIEPSEENHAEKDGVRKCEAMQPDSWASVVKDETQKIGNIFFFYADLLSVILELRMIKEIAEVNKRSMGQ